MGETCGECGNARIETHTGDEQLVCWKDANCGMAVMPRCTCPSWTPRLEPVGECVDALLRRVHDLEKELAAIRQWHRERTADIAKTRVAARRAFKLARSLYDLAPKEAVPVEYAMKLNEICDDLVDLGVEVD